LNESESEVWPQIAPILDAAMAGLSEADHDASRCVSLMAKA